MTLPRGRGEYSGRVSSSFSCESAVGNRVRGGGKLPPDASRAALLSRARCRGDRWSPAWARTELASRTFFRCSSPSSPPSPGSVISPAAMFLADRSKRSVTPLARRLECTEDSAEDGPEGGVISASPLRGDSFRGERLCFFSCFFSPFLPCFPSRGEREAAVSLEVSAEECRR